MSIKAKKKRHIILIILAIVLAVVAAGTLILMTHTQIVVITEIKYSDNYPNSFLDITYPDEDREAPRPTLIYFHGGGFFGGSKNVGDPLAGSDATALLDDICTEGFHFHRLRHTYTTKVHETSYILLYLTLCLF